MSYALETVTLLEGGLDAVKQASKQLDAAGIANSFTTAVGCKPGS